MLAPAAPEPAAGENAKAASKEQKGMNEEELQLHVEKLKLTEEQTKLREQVKQELKKNDLFDEEFCTNEELNRFCKARNFDFKKVYTMLKECITWRRTAKPQNIRPSEVESESVTGKTYIAGKDKYGRPVIVMDSSCENSKDHDTKIKYLLFNLEHAKRLMEGNVDKWVLFIYLDKYSFFSAPPIKTSLETNRCLTLRYPERLGHCFLYQPPSLFSVVWKMASPLIDPRTKKKINFMSGSFDKGSANDSKLSEVLGDDWRDLVGVDDKHETTKARGYDHDKVWSEVCGMYKSDNEEESKQS